MDISGFRQDPQAARIRGENVVAVGGQAHHSGAHRIPLATAGQQQPRPAPQRVIDRCDIGPGEQPGDWNLAATATDTFPGGGRGFDGTGCLPRR